MPQPGAGNAGLLVQPTMSLEVLMVLDPGTGAEALEHAGSAGGAALAYVALGYAVLPIWPPQPGGCACPRGSACPWPGKHPLGELVPHGARQATISPALVRGWWRTCPDASVGLRTGPGALDVADVDSQAGVEALRAILQSAGADTRSWPLARTGGGGWHLPFAPTGLGNRVRMLAGVDWRGAGGLIVAWPSVHASGHRYTWVRPLPPAGELPEVPTALRRLLEPTPSASQPPPSAVEPVRRAGAYAAAALAGEVVKVRTTAPGGRNHAVNRAAFKLARLVVVGELGEAEISAALAEAAATAGLGKVEAAHAIASGLAAGQDPTRHQALARRQGGGAR
jgi:hypothetical protein